MSGRIRVRNSANAPDSATITANERILKECHNLYADSDNGLIDIAEGLGLSLLAPRKKIIVLLLGNHSAGKSTFINWYVEDQIQKTGVAIETQGFTFVTSGRKRESLTGNATLHLYPHFKPLQKIPGLVDYLNTEISTSKQKKFSLVTFVDTPGLVDGDMKYPFDVNKAILWLGNLADLFFVFFDPMGQALCKRTLTLVEKLNEKHSERIRFFLSKADEAGQESDRQRVMMQIVQELCKRPGLNRTGFDMPTIYIPNQNKASRCVNQIDVVCKEIEKTINHTIQNTLNTLEKDCEKISGLIDAKIRCSHSNASNNLRARGRWLLFSAFGIILPLVLFLNFLSTSLSRNVLLTTLGNTTVDYLDSYLSPIRQFWRGIPVDYHMHVLATMIVISLGLLVLAKVLTRIQPTLSRKQMRDLLEKKDYIENYVKSKKRTLYSEYLRQSVSEHDLS